MELQDFNVLRLERQYIAMLILGAWAITNIIIGIIGANWSSGTRKQFFVMNAGWNVVNLVLAGIGIYVALTTNPAALGLYETVGAHQGIQKTLLFNAGLDIGYIAIGFYLIEKGKNTTKHQDRWQGFGQALLLQGAFLFVFDLTIYFWQANLNKALEPLLSTL